MLAISSRLDSLRGCADKTRGCVEWARTVEITIRTRTWSGDELGSGTTTDSDLVMSPRCPVRQLSAREVASSNGLFEQGDLLVEGISPPFTSHGGGGYTAAQLNPKLAVGIENVEVLFLLDGETTGIWTLVSLDTTNVTAWSMVLRRTRLTP